MRYIQDTNPIVTIDEPQSVDNTPKAREAIASLHPLCVLRRSATHREKINSYLALPDLITAAGKNTSRRWKTGWKCRQ